MLELTQLQHLAAFHKAGTLLQAAEELHIFQPALSSIIFYVCRKEDYGKLKLFFQQLPKE